MAPSALEENKFLEKWEPVSKSLNQKPYVVGLVMEGLKSSDALLLPRKSWYNFPKYQTFYDIRYRIS